MAEWTKECPTEPGWWFYEDPFFGPAPIHVEWAGTTSAILIVDTTSTNDEELLFNPVASLEGIWYLIEEPPRQHNEWEDSQLS